MSHPETDPAGVDGNAAEQPTTPIVPAPQAARAAEGDPTAQPPQGQDREQGDPHTSGRTAPKAAAAAAASAAASMGITTPVQASRKPHRPQNYAAAVYGSVLASSVVISAGDLRQPVTLAALLVTSGLVFWIAHVYAATVASVHGGWHYGAIRTGMAHEWPVAFASIPPAAAALVAGLIPSVTLSEGVWAALIVAIAEQQLWGYAAVKNARLSGPALTRTMLLNVFMGFIIVALKLGVGH
jgi:hypothetical protein